MRSSFRFFGAGMMLAAPTAVLFLLRTFPSLDRQFFSAESHLVVVSVIAGLATVVAAVAAFTARTARHPGLVHLSMGASAAGLLMLGHGLTTPGVIGQVRNPWVGRFPALALLLFALTLFTSGVRVDRPVQRFVARHPLAIVGGWWLSLGAVTAVLVSDPSLFAQPSWEENLLDAAAVLTIVLSLVVVWVHWHRWQLGKDVVQLSLTFAAAMTVAATLSLEHGQFQRVSWWDYHAYLLAGFGCAVFAILARSTASRRVSEVLDTAFSDDVFTHIVDGYPEALRHMVRAVEVRDAYTHGHSERTATVAIELGMRLQLPPDRLRVIARGAFLHDLGKIGIPDAVLNKPARLTEEERKLIETHPTVGYEMAKEAASLHEALHVILHHHERYDGGGYPAGLVGSDIPLEARVVAVADVWDALTTDRAYRAGWPAEKALAHIVAASGSHFDPTVVSAMIALAAEWGIGRDHEPGRAEEAWVAAQSCHQAGADETLVGA